MIITSEYVFNKPKLNEITNIIKNTEGEHNEKYEFDQKTKQRLYAMSNLQIN